MSYDDILMLKETLQIIDQGCYEHEGKEVKPRCISLTGLQRSAAVGTQIWLWKMNVFMTAQIWILIHMPEKYMQSERKKSV